MKKLLFVALILCEASFAQTNVARMLSGVNAQTGTSYTFVASDVTKIVTFNNANPVGATLPVGSTTGFGAGSVFTAVNLGAGTVTVSCSGCTINGAATVQIVQNQSVSLYGDGTNYISASGGGGGGGGSISGSTALGTQVGGNGAGGFSSNAKPFIDVRDYGVDCTGVGDSTTALQTMINNAPDYSSFLFPPACKVTITGATGITIDQRIGLQFVFSGRNGNGCAASTTPAEIVYTQTYAPGNRVFYINRSQSLEFRNVTITGNGTFDIGFDVDQIGATPPITTRNDWYNTCIRNSSNTRNSSFEGFAFSRTSTSNVDNEHLYHPDIQCSASSPTSNTSNGYAIFQANSANLKNNIVEDVRSGNCSQVLDASGGDTTFAYGLDSSSYTVAQFTGFNQQLNGFRSESATQAVLIGQAIGPYLITHNDFSASGGTIVDAPNGCGTLTFFNNQQDSSSTTTINCHSGSGSVIALNNRNFNMSPTTAPGFVISPYLAGPLSQAGGITNLDTNWFSIPLRFTPASGGADYGVVFDTLRSGTYDHFGIQAVPQNSDTNVGLNINYLGTATGYIGIGATVPGLKVGPNTTAAQSAPTISPRGATGATSYTYLVQAVTMTGHSDCSITTTVANANASLDGTNFNVIIWEAYAGALKYKIYRTASGGAPATTGLIGTQIGYTGVGHNTGNDNLLTFADTGLAGDGATCAAGNTTGELLTAASTAGRAGLNIPHGTAPSVPVNGDLWTTTAGLWAQINGATVGPFSTGGGGGGLSGQTTLGFPIAATATTSISSTTPGTNQGTYILGRFNTVQGSATSPIELQAGDCSTPGVISGATATYTIAYTDVIGCNVVHDIAASHSTVVTIPNPATLNNPSPIFVYTNNSPNADTLTPSTYQISMGSAAAGASLSVPSNVSCKVQLDPVNGSTYKADCHLISTSTPTVTFSGSSSVAVSAGTGVNAAANGTVLVADGSGNAIPRPAISTVGLGGVWTNGNPLGIPVANGSNSTLVNATMYVQQVNLVTEQVIGNATFDMVTCAACAEVINACMYNSAGSTLLWSGVSGTINGTGAFSATGTQSTLTRGVYYFAYSASGGGVAVIQGYTAGGSTTDNILNKNAVREGTAANGISGGACPASLGVLTGTTTGPAKGTFALEP